MDTRDKNGISILMLPWLAHGHISAHLNLAKKLSTKNFKIYLCSTPINLHSIKKQITEKYSNSIQLVELNLESLPDLPPHYHTTNGLPPHLMVTLKTAFENSSHRFSNIYKSLKPDLLIYDFNQPWAADIALSNNIPAVQFVTVSAMMASFVRHNLVCPAENYPFPISLHRYFIEKMKERFRSPSIDDAKETNIIRRARERSYKIFLLRTFREIEGKYIDYVSVLSKKKGIPVGPLVEETLEDTDDPAEIIPWLNTKEESSVVFVSFGSEYFLSKEEIDEIAYGLELSKLNFVWVVRFHIGEKTKLQEWLPLGFQDRVGERGVVIDGWVPQAKILGHSSIGGFVSHCGWASTMESMTMGVPIIAMPMQIDQPFNAILVEDVGVGLQVKRDENGNFNRENIAEVIRNVVVEKRGEVVKRNAREMSERIRVKGDKEIDELVEELLKLCKEKKDEVVSSKMIP